VAGLSPIIPINGGNMSGEEPSSTTLLITAAPRRPRRAV